MSKGIIFFKKIVIIKFLSQKNYRKKTISLINDLKESVKNLVNLMNNQNLNEYIKKVVGFSFATNKYFNDLEPWAVKKRSRKNERYFVYSF